ncbi:hypothetical protein FQA39_LY03932 [Lamprigera yunnana]|nr:hypothetical protein FQA39_LY03932 [Lamprigera yunnana]
MFCNKSILICVFYINIIVCGHHHDLHLEPFELDEIIDGSYNDEDWNGTWISDSTFWFKDKKRNVCLFDASKNDTKLLLNSDIFHNFNDWDISFSDDLECVLIKYNERIISPQIRVAQYSVYVLEEKKYYNICNLNHFQLAQWVPKNNSLIYVYENNIYYLPDFSEIVTTKQITYDGICGEVYNGVTDYIYEGVPALVFSPNGLCLAFAQFNDTEVDDVYYYLYGDSQDLHPSLVKFKYPKVGRKNPKVIIKYINLSDSKSQAAEFEDMVPTHLVSKDYILYDLTWANNTDILKQEIKNGWALLSNPLFSSDGTRYVIISPEIENGYIYQHLSVITENDFHNRRRLTYGTKVVTSIYGWDEIRNLIYYEGTVINEYGQRHVYVFHLNTNKDNCLTCNVKTPEEMCKAANCHFSRQYSYYAEICTGPGPKIIHIKNLENFHLYEWENNSNLRTRLSKKLSPIQKVLEVSLYDGFTAHVRLLLPPQFNEEAEVQYPLLVHVYAAPNSNSITDDYSTDANYFVTNRKFIYARIDGHESSRGRADYMFKLYRQLGTIEVMDQIIVTKHVNVKNKINVLILILQLLLPTLNIIVLLCIIALLRNLWIFVGSIFTERFMGLNLEEDNATGYNNTDLSQSVEKLRDKLFCIIHGSGDDNVHYQQLMLFVKALQRAHIMFHQQIYPDENHNFQNVRPHLFYTIDNFIEFGYDLNNN